MKLTDHNPRWVGYGGEGISDANGDPVPARSGVGLTFNCPCGTCGQRPYIGFQNPLDGGPPVSNGPHWNRAGETFETLTVTPSILRKSGCDWHGWLKFGELTSC